MARVQLKTLLQPTIDRAGNAKTGATVQVNERGASAATWYTAESGGSSSTAALTTTRGRVPDAAYVEAGSYDVVTTFGGQSTTDKVEAVAGSTVQIILDPDIIGAVSIVLDDGTTGYLPVYASADL